MKLSNEETDAGEQQQQHGTPPSAKLLHTYIHSMALVLSTGGGRGETGLSLELESDVVYSFGYPFPVHPNTEYSGSELYPNIRVTRYRYVVNVRVHPRYIRVRWPRIFTQS
jgi:hypothetical protein